MGFHNMQLTDEQLNFLYTLLGRVEGHDYTLIVLKEALADMGAEIAKTPVFSGKIEILQGKFLSWNELKEYGEYEVFMEDGSRLGWNFLKTTTPSSFSTTTNHFLLDYSKVKIHLVICTACLEDKYFRKIE